MTRRTPFSWIINNLTYLQTFILICALFFISLIPIGYFWIKTHLDRIGLIDEQIEELKEERALQSLFKELQEHRALTQRLLMAHESAESREAMEKVDLNIHQAFDAFLNEDIFTHGRFTYEPSIWKKVNPHNVQHRWKELLSQVETVGHQEVEPLHTNIIHDLLIQFSYLSDKVGISSFNEIENYSLIEAIFLRLPIIQESLAQLILLGERFLLSGGKELSRDRIVTLINALESDLAYLKFGDTFEGLSQSDTIRSVLLNSLNSTAMPLKR